jgi:RNA polymerase sigma-70 factor (ECF subfamily)
MTEDEFLAIYREEAPLVFRFCAFRTGSAHVAEDLCAETFARLLAKGAAVAADRRVAWLHTVARNLCTDWARGRRPWVPLDALADPPTQEVEPVWLDPAVSRAVGQLSAAQQQVLFLRAVEGLPFERIAVMTKAREPATRMRYGRALASLRRMLVEVEG